MIYLSRLLLNPRASQVQAELRAPYEMHRTLAKAFGDGMGEFDAARCLFRVEPAQAQGIMVLVQSLAAPQWDHLTVSARYLLEAPVVKPFTPALLAGERLRFRLRANPTVKRAGKRLPLRDETEQIAWLRRKGEQHGFTLVAVRLHAADTTCSRTTGGHQATLEGITFDGVLRINDTTAFTAALQHGIGSGKGFGFGLLSVARRC